MLDPDPDQMSADPQPLDLTTTGPNNRMQSFCREHRVPTPTLPSSKLGKAGRNHLNEEILIQIRVQISVS